MLKARFFFIMRFPAFGGVEWLTGAVDVEVGDLRPVNSKLAVESGELGDAVRTAFGPGVVCLLP